MQEKKLSKKSHSAEYCRTLPKIPYLYTLSRTIPYLNTLSRTIIYVKKKPQFNPKPNSCRQPIKIEHEKP